MFPYGVVSVFAELRSGETLFKKHCAVCHPNISKLQKIRSIVEGMRNPLPFMPAFDKAKIPDEDAIEIENYIIKSTPKQGNGRQVKKRETETERSINNYRE